MLAIRTEALCLRPIINVDLYYGLKSASRAADGKMSNLIRGDKRRVTSPEIPPLEKLPPKVTPADCSNTLKAKIRELALTRTPDPSHEAGS